MSDEDEDYTYVKNMTFVDDNGVEFKYTGDTENGKPIYGTHCKYIKLFREKEKIIQKIIYKGAMINGKRHGEGEYILLDYKNYLILTYNGDWVNDMKHGYGELNKYEGVNENNDINNIYDIEYSNRRSKYTYDGKWKNDLKDGIGKEDKLYFYDEDWGCESEIYSGEFKDGKRHGKGRVTIPTYGREETVLDRKGYYSHKELVKYFHESYDGIWVDGKMNGLCTFIDENDKVYEGNMVNGKKHGIFISKTYYYKDEELSKDDERIKEIQTEVEKNKLAAVLDKKVTLGTKEDIGEVLNSVGY